MILQVSGLCLHVSRRTIESLTINFMVCALPRINQLNQLFQTSASFSFIFGLFKQTIQFLQQINVKNVMSIQYPAPGFEPTTFWNVSLLP